MSKPHAFSIVGDSISTFEGYTPAGNRVYYEEPQISETGVTDVEDTWWMRVIRHFGGEFVSSNAYSGSMVAGPSFPAGNSWERVRQLTGSPDTVLVFIGLNAYGWGGVRNQIMARSAAMPQCEEALAIAPGQSEGADENALEEFSAAYRLMLERIRQHLPEADIVCITVPPGRELGKSEPSFCYSLRGFALDDYNAAIRRIASELGCKVADVASLGYDYEAKDGSHPTKRGMEQFAAMVIHEMDGTPLDEALFDEGQLASERRCEQDSCLGCEWARGVGNVWSCVCDRP